jgi:hypothetical protein
LKIGPTAELYTNRGVINQVHVCFGFCLLCCQNSSWILPVALSP